jgi:hypothetical protein
VSLHTLLFTIIITLVLLLLLLLTLVLGPLLVQQRALCRSESW